MAGAVTLSDAELVEIGRRFEHQPATSVIGWAVESFHPDLCLTTSMADAVMVHLAVSVEPSIEVVFIDTGYHFPETLDTVEEAQRRYRLNLRIMRVPEHDPPLWQADPENCCGRAKVAQLEQALAGKRAWMSGLRRSDSASRAATPIVVRDERGLIKINPLATWTDEDVASYVTEHEVVTNPLLDKGYASVGCAPCTVPVSAGADPRSGRWPGREREECGLHGRFGPNG